MNLFFTKTIKEINVKILFPVGSAELVILPMGIIKLLVQVRLGLTVPAGDSNPAGVADQAGDAGLGDGGQGAGARGAGWQAYSCGAEQLRQSDAK